MSSSAFRVHSVAADRDWLERAVDAHQRTLSAGESVLKDEHKTTITRIVHDGCAAVVKHYRYIGVRFWLKGLLRTHPAWRSLRASVEMARRGVPTPAVLGLVERRRLGLLAEAWLITDDTANAVEMDRYVLRNFPVGCDRLRRRRFVLAFADTFRHLMESGISHRDLKTCNILVVEDGQSWRFTFIDLDDVSVRSESWRANRDDWILALAQLNPSTPKILPWTDRLRFLDRLGEVIQFPRKPLVARVQELSRRRRRAYFSDEGTVEIDFV